MKCESSPNHHQRPAVWIYGFRYFLYTQHDFKNHLVPTDSVCRGFDLLFFKLRSQGWRLPDVEHRLGGDTGRCLGHPDAAQKRISHVLKTGPWYTGRFFVEQESQGSLGVRRIEPVGVQEVG